VADEVFLRDGGIDMSRSAQRTARSPRILGWVSAIPVVMILFVAACSASPSSTLGPSGGSPTASPSPSTGTTAGPTATPIPTLSVGPTETVGATEQPTEVPTLPPVATPTPSVAPTPTEPPAASESRPDARIRLRDIRYKYPDSSTWETDSQDNPWLGNGIYNTTGKNQTAKESYYSTTVAEVTSWRFAISIENDGDASDRFLVKATGPALPPGFCFEGTCHKWKIDWFRDSTKITSAVVDGTFKTAQLGPGETEVIVAEVTTDSYDGDVTRLLTLTSVGDSSRQDAVKIVIKQLSCGC
jgi:hypothetical protein